MHIKKTSIPVMVLVCIYILISNLILLQHAMPTGYQIDIYSQLPLEFYIGLMFCYLVSSILMIENYKKFALYLLFFISIEVLMIPYMLGYFWTDRADDITYIGESIYIQNTGTVDLFNVYPASHIICSILSLTTAYNMNIVCYIFSICVFFLFVLGMILISKIFVDESKIINITLASSFVFYFSRFCFSIVPHYIFFCMLPYYFYIFYSCLKTRNTSMSVCLVILVLISPFTHPFIIFFLLFLIVMILFLNLAFKLKLNDLKTDLVLLVTCFLFWFLANKGYSRDLTIIYRAYTSFSSESTLTMTGSSLSKIGLNAFDLFKLLNFYYGRYYIPVAFIIIATYLIYVNKDSYPKNLLNKYLSLLSIFLIFLIFQVFLLLNDIIPHQPDRFTSLNFAVFPQILLFAYSLYIIFLRTFPSKKNIYLVALILTLVWSLSFFGSFNSPYIYRPNNAFTYNEVDGMAWFYGVKSNYAVSNPFTQMNRFHDLFGDIRYRDPTISLPDHFGYDAQIKNFSQINLKRNRHAYLIITSCDELTYEKVPGFTNVGRYNVKDFETLNNDPSVNKFYDSLNLDLYFI